MSEQNKTVGVRVHDDGADCWCHPTVSEVGIGHVVPLGETHQLDVAGRKPTVGRTVYYVSYGTPDGEYKSECRAAIITWVHPDTIDAEDQLVSLCVLDPNGMFFNETVAYHEGDVGHDHTGAEIPALSYRGGTWHWPERV